MSYLEFTVLLYLIISYSQQQAANSSDMSKMDHSMMNMDHSKMDHSKMNMPSSNK